MHCVHASRSKNTEKVKITKQLKQKTYQKINLKADQQVELQHCVVEMAVGFGVRSERATNNDPNSNKLACVNEVNVKENDHS